MPKGRSNGSKSSTTKTAKSRSNASNYAKTSSTKKVAKSRTNAASRKSKKT